MTSGTVIRGVVLGAVLAAAAACSPTTPTPGPPAAGPPSTGADPELGPADSPIGRLRPCGMISEEAAAANGLRGRGTTRFAGARACQFGADDTMAVVTLDDQQSVDALQDYPRAVPYTVGNHRGRLVRDALEKGTCAIALGTSPRTYVEFYVKTGEDTERACRAAEGFVRDAAPTLP